VLPPQPWVEEAINCGAMRLCAICDGFEVSDDDLAVYGPLRSAVNHARFMRTYSAKVNEDQMTSIDGLHAIGDVVSALNQISVAEGHAAVAATAIHNVLPRNLRLASGQMP